MPTSEFRIQNRTGFSTLNSGLKIKVAVTVFYTILRRYASQNYGREEIRDE
jgi:hypothetical protein